MKPRGGAKDSYAIEVKLDDGTGNGEVTRLDEGTGIWLPDESFFLSCRTGADGRNPNAVIIVYPPLLDDGTLRSDTTHLLAMTGPCGASDLFAHM